MIYFKIFLTTTRMPHGQVNHCSLFLFQPNGNQQQRNEVGCQNPVHCLLMFALGSYWFIRNNLPHWATKKLIGEKYIQICGWNRTKWITCKIFWQHIKGQEKLYHFLDTFPHFVQPFSGAQLGLYFIWK